MTKRPDQHLHDAEAALEALQHRVLEALTIGITERMDARAAGDAAQDAKLTKGIDAVLATLVASIEQRVVLRRRMPARHAASKARN
ncbi:hypothetical protein [Falsiroseomonas tokyonensis]|uniref:Uncharacterized protein n=1 Tax=Falsiroseomonas tokyonensis TaxID=430521 RepID=A0ABV7BXX3_9PROT|nr:hypothetical protein [Falsiroseomonas tokyonensis]MBU8539494.1 hypothetical protein [Falsiroseomonas tokyonensis]